MGAAGRRLQRLPIAQRPLEERCRRAWAVNIETDQPVAFVMLEAGRAIKEGAIHLESLIPKVRLEPTPSCEDRILSPVRQP